MRSEQHIQFVYFPDKLRFVIITRYYKGIIFFFILH